MDDTDQHQKGNRCKGQKLRKVDTPEPVDPAGLFPTEKVGHEFGHSAGTPEQQDQSEPDDKGWRDDRQDREDPQQPLGAEVGAGEYQRESKTKDCRPCARHHRQKERVDRNTTGAVPEQASEPPDVAAEEPREELGQGIAAVHLKRTHQNMHHGKEDEYPHKRDNQTDGADHKGVALTFAGL